MEQTTKVVAFSFGRIDIMEPSNSICLLLQNAALPAFLAEHVVLANVRVGSITGCGQQRSIFVRKLIARGVACYNCVLQDFA